MYAVWALQILGCVPAEPGPGDAGASDAADDSSTTHPVRDSDTSARDTGDGPDPELRLVIKGDIEGLGVVLFRVERPEATTRTDFGFGVPLVSRPVKSKTDALPLSAPPASHLQSVSGTPVPMAAYLVALFEDTNLNGTRDEQERLAAVSTTFPTFVGRSGPLPEDLADRGLLPGWNAAVWWEEDPVRVVQPNVVPIQVIPENATLDLGGTLDGDLATRRLVLLSANDDPELTTAERLYDDVASTPFAISLKGAPPKDHLSEILPYTSHTLYVASDDDGSTTYTEGDTRLGRVCRSGGRRLFIASWVERTPDPRFTWLYEGQTGWVGFDTNLTKKGAVYRILTGTVDDLVYDDTCL